MCKAEVRATSVSLWPGKLTEPGTRDRRGPGALAGLVRAVPPADRAGANRHLPGPGGAGRQRGRSEVRAHGHMPKVTCQWSRTRPAAARGDGNGYPGPSPLPRRPNSLCRFTPPRRGKKDAAAGPQPACRANTGSGRNGQTDSDKAKWSNRL